MAEVGRSVRVRALLEEWMLAILVLLVIVAVVLGWWTYQVNAVPEFEQQERLVEEWSESTDFDHGAIAVNETLVWDQGERLTNRPIYYYRVSPVLDGVYSYGYGADEGDVTVQTDSRLVIRAVDEEAVFWEVTAPLASDTSDGLGPGDTHESEFSVNITYVLHTIATVEEELGAREGLVDVRVVSESSIQGEVEGGEVDARYRSDMPMVVSPDTFRVLELETVDEQHQTVEMVTVPVTPSPIAAYGSIALFALVVGSLLALTVGWYTGRIECSDEERELLRIERQRDRFSEWITTGNFPSEQQYESTIWVDDLEGLVDVAIDTNKRVIDDPELGVSTVLDDDYVYMYVRPDSPAREWLLNFADVTLDEFEGRDR